MSRRPISARMDVRVLAIARRLAASENRSITTIFELALLEYAERRGEIIPPAVEITARFIAAGTGKV
jgi:hypothetical protein